MYGNDSSLSKDQWTEGYPPPLSANHKAVPSKKKRGGGSWDVEPLGGRRKEKWDADVVENYSLEQIAIFVVVISHFSQKYKLFMQNSNLHIRCKKWQNEVI